MRILMDLIIPQTEAQIVEKTVVAPVIISVLAVAVVAAVIIIYAVKKKRK